MSTLYAITIGMSVFLVACWFGAKVALDKFVPREEGE
jgi:hypothetical protein